MHVATGNRKKNIKITLLQNFSPVSAPDIVMN